MRGDRTERTGTTDRDDAAQATPRRRDAIDFWRGFILCTIFINHVPGNLFERLTFRNFGFSDSSEAFVFISGVSLALAYGRPFLGEGRGEAVAGMLRRAVKLYAVHIGLSLAGLAIFGAGALLTADADLMHVHGRDLVVDEPGTALVGLLSLGHQFGYFNILPMYVLFVGVAPVLFWLAAVSRPLMLGVSLTVYVLARATGLNVPSWPMQGSWFFDPFTWQLLVAIGLAVGLELRKGIGVNRGLLAVAAVVVAIGLVCETNGFGAFPGLSDTARRVFDLDKTALGAGRIVHFLCLAYVVHGLALARHMRQAPWYRPLCLIGRHGLLMFGLLSLMAAAGQVVTQVYGHGPLIDTAVIGCGLAALYVSAVLVSQGRMRQAGSRSSDAHAVPHPAMLPPRHR